MGDSKRIDEALCREIYEFEDSDICVVLKHATEITGSDAMRVVLSITHAGREIGHMVRSIEREAEERLYARHRSIHVHEKTTWDAKADLPRGIGRRIVDHQVGMYRKHGIERFVIEAKNLGVEYWARPGIYFGHVGSPSDDNGQWAGFDGLVEQWSRDGLVDGRAEAIRLLTLDESRPPLPREVRRGCVRCILDLGDTRSWVGTGFVDEFGWGVH